MSHVSGVSSLSWQSSEQLEFSRMYEEHQRQHQEQQQPQQQEEEQQQQQHWQGDRWYWQHEQPEQEQQQQQNLGVEDESAVAATAIAEESQASATEEQQQQAVIVVPSEDYVPEPLASLSLSVEELNELMLNHALYVSARDQGRADAAYAARLAGAEAVLHS